MCNLLKKSIFQTGIKTPGAAGRLKRVKR